MTAPRPAAGAPRTYRFPDFERHVLPNGLTVWLVPLPERELVNVHLLSDAGAAAEDEAQAGVAALTAQLLVTGTRRLDAAAFAGTTERLGIEVSSESNWDSARAAFQALSAHLDAGLGLLAEMIRTPRLDEREFERIRAERLNDILQARADPGRLADESFLRHVFAADVPYGRLSAGTPETVGALGATDVQRFHATRYAPNVAHLILAGALDRDAALAAVERHLGDWSGEAPGHRSFTTTARGGRRVVVVDRPGSVQSELRVGHPGIDRHDPRYFPALVMAALLGGVFGSRLNRRLREELGYTYGARCAFDPRRAVGPFTANAAVQTEVTVDAIRELLGQLARVREAPPEPDELAEVRNFLVGVFPLRFETTGGIAAAIEPLAVYGLPDHWWREYRENLEAVDPAAVHRAALELVRPDEALILLAGDAARIRDDLEAAAFGPVEVVTAEAALSR
ncbi:MAG TPA: pitrilysin family protein [Candidatus Limnocylindria bacterium]|nr:pitrilysin family protein [Candidatus Limnocylindria bacterium]